MSETTSNHNHRDAADECKPPTAWKQLNMGLLVLIAHQDFIKMFKGIISVLYAAAVTCMVCFT